MGFTRSILEGSLSVCVLLNIVQISVNSQFGGEDYRSFEYGAIP